MEPLLNNAPTKITIHPLAEAERNLSPYQARKQTAPDIVNDNFFGSFADILDVINPLQHIPVVSTIYRELTGDTLSQGARMAGGAIFGGPIGLFASIIDNIVIGATDKDLGANLFAAATGKYQETAKLTELELEQGFGPS